MQFESFHWLSHHELWAIIAWSMNMVSICASFWGVFIFTFSLLYFEAVYSMIPIALVGYEKIMANSYPMWTRGIMVK